MKFDTKLPKKYPGRLLELPAFDEQGRITRRVRASLENTLYIHSNISRIHARNTHNNPRNFLVEEVYIIGSCARLNRIDSDMDYLLICPSIDERSADHLKEVISYVLFCDRDKREAVDVYIRPADKYPERASVNITDQVRKILKKYNKIISQE
jgi:hypothetical protein